MNYPFERRVEDTCVVDNFDQVIHVDNGFLAYLHESWSDVEYGFALNASFHAKRVGHSGYYHFPLSYFVIILECANVLYMHKSEIRCRCIKQQFVSVGVGCCKRVERRFIA